MSTDECSDSVPKNYQFLNGGFTFQEESLVDLMDEDLDFSQVTTPPPQAGKEEEKNEILATMPPAKGKGKSGAETQR